MQEYKEVLCIKRMNEEHKNVFDKLVDAYGGKLSSRIVYENAVFTLHDFEHHCYDIYKIISNVLFDEKLVFGHENDYILASRVLLILNVAVLFHDIGMSQVLGAVRENHAIKSAQFIQDEYDKTSPLRQFGGFTQSEINAIKAIVAAHSDDKTQTVDPEKNGLRSPKLSQTYYTRDDKKIPVLFLAGVLRIADELDISSERLGTSELELQLIEGIKKYRKLKIKKEVGKEDIEKWENYSKSLKHWENLHLISGVKRNNDGETIDIILDDDQIDRFLDEGKTEESIAEDIADIYLGIDKKLKEAVKLCFCGAIYGKCVYVKKLQIITENKKIFSEFQNKLNIKSLRIQNSPSNDIPKREALTSDMPYSIDPKLESFISDEVKKRGLINFGHFILNEKYCARDWIDTREVIETKELLNKIVSNIVKDINSRKHNNYVIVGVDLVGALLASRIAFSLQKPLSYIVSEKEEKNNADREIELNINKNDEIILITDAIVTYETIHKAINKYNLEGRIDSIYTMFYRYSDNFKCDSIYLEKTYSINNKFPIELFEKSKCVYKEDKCIAQNQKLTKL